MVDLKNAAIKFLDLILEHYPDKEISKYTRLVDQLEGFIRDDSWGDSLCSRSDCVSPTCNFEDD